MADALKPPPVKPEVVAFIKEGSPKPQTPNPLISMAAPTVPTSPQPDTVAEALKPVQTKLRASMIKGPSSEPPPMVPMNLRLPAELSKTLLKASSERKLEKRKPFTQQAIIAEALEAWFQVNGYNPRNS